MNTNDLDERGWKRLISAISEKRVVPIIGKELFKHDGKPLQSYINKMICEKFVIDYKEDMTIDQIIESSNNLFGDGKREYCRELAKVSQKLDITPPNCLQKLLDTGLFPLVLTTSYTPVLENYLIKKDNRWDVYAYDKRGRLIDKADIPPFSANSQFLYYLFGKAGAKGSFVLDEDDLLSFLHFWHNEETRPKELCKYLSDKILLIIGCDYPDWLFRFMWYSMNDNFQESPRKGQLVLSNQKVMEDAELQSFLHRIKAYYNNDTERFTIELCNRCDELLDTKNDSDPIDGLHKKPSIDFFISYAHEDYETASAIANQLEKLGAKVWLDKNMLEPGDVFPEHIKTNIQRCKRFMPILSRNTIQEKRRFFRLEWAEALEESKFRLGMPYLMPITIDSVSIDDPLIPLAFKNVHIMKYTEEIETEFKNLIRDIRR